MIHVSEKVRNAVAEGRPVVALESTIISHGMPYPANRDTALRLEAIIEAEGAVPATVGMLGGRIVVGLSHDEIEQLAKPGSGAFKAASKDLAFAAAAERDAGTTVSATMLCAHRAGISVFATGGIGGVHRGAELSFDVSSDLLEFARTPVIVVSAGCKSILDIPKTLEYLETIGVPVVGYGCSEFPAFHSRTSRIPLSLFTSELSLVAEAWEANKALGRSNGMVVANPIPADAEIPLDEIEIWISGALEELAKRGVSGKEVTPFLLAEIGKRSQGRTQVANQALVENNARVGARLAIEVARLAQMHASKVIS